VMQSWIFSIITPVFRVTWSFRNHSSVLMWCSKKLFLLLSMLETLVVLHIYVKTINNIFSPGFSDEKKYYKISSE